MWVVLSHVLSDEAVSAAYATGRAVYDTRRKERQAGRSAQAEGTDPYTMGRVTFAEGVRESDFTGHRKKSLAVARAVTETFGLSVVMERSVADVYGRRAMDNAWYDPNTGTIHLDMNAGANGEGIFLYAFAHEITHFAREWAEEDYNRLAEFLVEQYGKKGLSLSEVMDEYRNDDAYKDLSEDDLLEEIVAEHMQKMFADEYLAEKLAAHTEENKGFRTTVRRLFAAIRSAIKELQAFFARNKIGGTIGENIEALSDTVEQQADLYFTMMSRATFNRAATVAQAQMEGARAKKPPPGMSIANLKKFFASRRGHH